MSVTLTPKCVAYLASEEGLTTEAYLDTGGVWTWGLGVTDASGHEVSRYKDNPQPLAKVLDIGLWLIRQKYLPSVVEAFPGKVLNEAQTAAALSFHWNTGAIKKAEWIKAFVRGESDAEALIMEWSSHGLLTNRRKREQSLFFHGVWPANLSCSVYPVNPSNHHPLIYKGVKTDILPDLIKLMP